MCTTDNITLLRKTFELAEDSVKNGNQPFGALIADSNGNILITAENAEIHESPKVKDWDFTCHAEMNAIKEFAKREDLIKIATDLTLYSSTEPCLMCTGAFIKSKMGTI